MKSSVISIAFVDTPNANRELVKQLKTQGIPTQYKMQTNDSVCSPCILLSVIIQAAVPVLIACIYAIAKIKVANIENARVKITLPDGRSTEAPNRQQAIEIIDSIKRELPDQE